VSAAYCETAGHTWAGTTCSMCGEQRSPDDVPGGLPLTRRQWKLVMRALSAFTRAERNRLKRIRKGKAMMISASDQARLLADIADVHAMVTDHVEGRR